MNCERIKLSKTVYDMGMKVAAVSLMCQDERVFQAMEMAGTPCPYMGMIGKESSEAWADNADERPDAKAYADKKKPTRKERKAEKKRLKQVATDKKAEEKRIVQAKKDSDDKMNEELERRKQNFITQCSEEPNPTRERIKNDVVGAIDSLITPKTKTNGQCVKEWESLNI
jgi:archaellum component FlaD/FlaE